MASQPILANAPAPKTEMTWADAYVWPPILTHVPAPYNPCSCISYVKSVLGFEGFMGDAGSIKSNAEASVGSVVLLKEGKGHAGVVIGLTDEEITISEANYKP